MPKATKKRPNATPGGQSLIRDRQDAPNSPRLRLAGGVAIPKVPRSLEAATILSASPVILAEMPAFFDAMTQDQLKRGWRACLTTALMEELDCRALLHKQEARGILASFLRSMHVVHDRLIDLQ